VADPRMTFANFVDRAFWTLLLAIIGFGVKFLGELSTNVRELNSKIEAVIFESRVHETEIGDHEVRLQDHEHRLNALERAVTRKGNLYDPIPPRRSNGSRRRD